MPSYPYPPQKPGFRRVRLAALENLQPGDVYLSRLPRSGMYLVDRPAAAEHSEACPPTKIKKSEWRTAYLELRALVLALKEARAAEIERRSRGFQQTAHEEWAALPKKDRKRLTEPSLAHPVTPRAWMEFARAAEEALGPGVRLSFERLLRNAEEVDRKVR